MIYYSLYISEIFQVTARNDTLSHPICIWCQCFIWGDAIGISRSLAS